MNILLMISLTLCQMHQQIFSFAQSSGFFFGSSSTMSTTTGAGQTCDCKFGLICPPGYIGGIDIRIVNNGSSCPVGYVRCCTSSGGSGGGLDDAFCGMRIIPSSPQPTQGQAPYGAYPWQAAILRLNDESVGGGALISTTHVLTAAHKVAGYEPKAIKVRLGEWNTSSTTEPYPYREYSIQPNGIIIHPEYNSLNLMNDIAILKLDGVVPTVNSPNINTVCLPNAAPVPGTRCWVAGWGKNAFGNNGNYQTILKQVDVPILTQAACQTALRKTRLGSNFVLNDNFLCAGAEPGKDACTGDGGSPLVCLAANGRFQAVGLVTWGIGCADSGIPGVYIKVFNYISWIRQMAT